MLDELATKLAGDVLIIGVGDDDHGDDGAGPLVARLLETAGVEHVIESGASPELDTWKIRERKPDTVLFVDAVDIGGKPGNLAILEPRDLRKSGFDTHRAPLKLTMDYLERELNCSCFVLAIQPSDVRQGAPMCEEVISAVGLVEDILKRLATRGDTAGRMK